MKTQRFYIRKKCEWCGIENDHYVDFECYIPKDRTVKYTLTCEHCYLKAYAINGVYRYIRYTCTLEEWNDFVPPEIEFDN